MTQIQKEYILTFFKNEDYAGWKNIAWNLIENGSCIVVGNSCIWNGGIGNFIKTEEAPEYVECIKYIFDLDAFLSSAWFIENKIAYMQQKYNERDRLLKEIKELEDLGEKERIQEYLKVNPNSLFKQQLEKRLSEL